MEITIDQLLKGKSTIIKGKEYLSTEAYVTPFLERMSKFTNDFQVQAQSPDQYTLTKNGDINLEDITYNRVWVQAILPDEMNYPNHKESISMLYAIDTRKPVVKIFRSGINMACLNLCVFNPSYLHINSLEPESAIDFKCLKYLMEETNDVAMWLKKLENKEIPYDPVVVNENLGFWVDNPIERSYDNGFGKVKIATSTCIDAYKLLYKNEESPYYVKPGDTTNMFNVYNAFTELISNDGTIKDRQGGDIINKAEKTLLLKDILQLV